MFNVIRIPTKFSKTIKRMSNEERLQVFDLLIKIWDWGEISPPDNIVWDVVQLIYGEWMNMEAKNGIKREKSSINLCSEWPGEVVPSDPGTRVEYSRVEENRIEYSKEWVLEEENNQIQDTKTKKKKVHDYSSLENDPEDSFAKETYLTLKKMWWNESIPLQEFIEYIDAFLVSKDISKQKWDFIKWQLWLKDFLIYWSNDKSTKKPNYLLKMRNSPSFNFNQKQYAKR